MKTKRLSNKGFRSLHQVVALAAFALIWGGQAKAYDGPPVVLVHGLSSSYEMWGKWENGGWESGSFLNTLVREGLTFGCSFYFKDGVALPGNLMTWIPPNQFQSAAIPIVGDVYTLTFSDNSRVGNNSFEAETGELVNYILPKIYEYTGKSEVVLVGHSKGGLVSVMASKIPGLGQPAIRKVVTFGTPFFGPIRPWHHSADSIALTLGLAFPPEDPTGRSVGRMESSKDLARDSEALKRLRSEGDLPSTVEYVSVVIRSYGGAWIFSDFKDFGVPRNEGFVSPPPGEEHLLYGSDDVVPAASQNLAFTSIGASQPNVITELLSIPDSPSVLHLQEADNGQLQRIVLGHLDQGFATIDIRGSVATDDGQPLIGKVELLVASSGAPIHDTVVGSTYTFSGLRLAAGLYRVRASASGWMAGAYEPAISDTLRVPDDVGANPVPPLTLHKTPIDPRAMVSTSLGSLSQNANSTPQLLEISAETGWKLYGLPQGLIAERVLGNVSINNGEITGSGAATIRIAVDQGRLPVGETRGTMVVRGSEGGVKSVAVALSNSSPALDASFQADVTIPDGEEKGPGESLTKTWRIKNSGSTAWDSSFALVYVAGNRLGSETSVGVSGTPAGASADVSVSMTSPTIPGRYRSYWQMRSPDGKFFGDRIWVDIQVAIRGRTEIVRVEPARAVVLPQGRSQEFSVRLRNLGNEWWVSGPGGVSTEGYFELRACNANGETAPGGVPFESPLYPGQGAPPYWIDRNRVVPVAESAVGPGGTGTFEFLGTVPAGLTPGLHEFHFRPYLTLGGCAFFPANAMVTFLVEVPSSQVSDPNVDLVRPVVSVGYPLGGERFSQGDSVRIRWSATDNSGIYGVHIEAVGSGGSRFTILDTNGDPNPNPGYVGWNINQPVGSYQIVVDAYDPGFARGSAKSGWFEVVAACEEPAAPHLWEPGVYSPTGNYPIQWSAVSGAKQYILQEDDSASFSSPAQYTVAATEKWFAGRPNGFYYYRLRATNSCGESGWSNTVDFGVRKNSAPFIVANPSVRDGATGVPRSGTRLSWSGGDPDGDTVKYILGIGTTPTPAREANGYRPWYTSWSAHTYWDNYPFQSGTTYYWYVDSKDARGLITEGPMWSFTAAYSYPDLVPVSITVDGTLSRSTPVTIRMTIRNQGIYPSLSAESKFYYSTAPDEKQLLLGTWMAVPSLQPGQEYVVQRTVTLSNLQSGTTYIVGDVLMSTSGAESDVTNNLLSEPITYTDVSAPEIWWIQFHSGSQEMVRTGNTYEVRSYLEDDIRLARANLEFTTDTLVWHPIATDVPMSGEWYLVQQDWTIPNDLPRGPDALRIRIVAWDSDGNSSVLVSQAYDVVDGTLPTVRVISPNGGEEWTVGAEVDVLWEATSPNGISSVAVMALDPLGDVLVYSTPGNNTGLVKWVVPNEPTNLGLIKVIAVDNVGNYAKDISDNYFSIIDPNQPTPPWGPVDVLTFTGEGHANPRMAVDSSGVLHMVVFAGWGIDYWKYASGAWFRIGTIYDNPLHHSMTNLAVSVDTQNHPHVVWKEDFGAVSPEFNDDVYYTSHNGSTWSSPLKLSHRVNNSAQSATYYCTLGLDSSDRVHVVWSERDRAEVPFNRHTYHRYFGGGSWTAAQTLPNDFYIDCEYSLSAIPAGGIAGLFLGWDWVSGNIAILESTWSPAGWTPLSFVSVAEFDHYYGAPQYLIAPGGTRLATWAHNYPYEDAGLLYSENTGTGWAAPSYIQRGKSVGSHSQRGALMALPNSGQLQLVWTEHIEGPTFLYPVLRYTQKTSVGWAPISTISSRPDGAVGDGNGIPASIAAIGDMLHVVWYGPYQPTGNNELKHGYADVSLDTTPPTISVSLPTLGSVLSCGQYTTIDWSAVDNQSVFDVSIVCSVDDWESSIPIAANIANTGTLAWSVPITEFQSAQIRVTARDNSGNEGVGYSGIFQIQDQSAPSVEVLAPDGEETWIAGTVEQVRWSASDNVHVTSVTLQYSTNGGNQWIPIDILLTNDGVYDWTVPDTYSNQSLVKVEAVDAKGNIGWDAGDAVFTIRAANNPPVTPFSPNPSVDQEIKAAAWMVSWRCSDPDGDSLTYKLYQGDSPTLTEANVVANGLHGTSRTLTTFLWEATNYWQVVASDGASTTTGPVWSFYAATPLQAPEWLDVSTSGTRTLAVSWQDTNVFADGFLLERKTLNPGEFAPVAVLPAEAGAFVDTGLEPNTAYVYRARALAAVRETENSNEAAATTDNGRPFVPQLVFPTDGATSVSVDVSFRWIGGDPDPEDQVVYELYLGPTIPPDFVTTQTSPIYTPPESLEYSRFYYVIIRATDDQGESAESAIGMFATGPEPTPLPPGGLLADQEGNTTITLQWANVSDNAVGVKVERRIGNGRYSQIGVSGSENYQDADLAPGQTHTYRVRAFNGSGDSDYSNETSLMIVGPTPTPVLPGVPDWQYLGP